MQNGETTSREEKRNQCFSSSTKVQYAAIQVQCFRTGCATNTNQGDQTRGTISPANEWHARPRAACGQPI